MRLRHLWMTAACLTVLARAVAADAQTSPTDTATAQTLFDEGKRLMLEHRYEDACPKLAESNRLDQGLGTMLFLGTCYEKTGATASAWSVFRDAVELGHKLSDAREQVAREHLDRVAPMLYKLTIVVPPEVAALPGLQVHRDGATVAEAAWGSEVPVDPGIHVIVAEAPSRKSWKQSVEALAKGGAATVTVPKLDAEPRIESPPPALPDGATGRTQRVVGWAVAAAGLVGGVTVGTVFGLNAKSQNDQANANGRCVDTTCQDAGGVALRHRAVTSSIIADVAFVAGGVLVTTGIAVVLLAPSAKGSVRAGMGPRTVWLEGSW